MAAKNKPTGTSQRQGFGKTAAEGPAGASKAAPVKRPSPVPPPAPQSARAVLAEHTVVAGETLSQLTVRYYQLANQWRPIYAFNQTVIGDNPNEITVGLKLKIPKL